jgi:hypothetical protein
MEPRISLDLLTRPELMFVGGVENYDLWYRPNKQVFLSTEFTLRVHRIPDLQWDVFKLPLRTNKETRLEWPPSERRWAGNWSDIELTHAEADLIETYLRCFAPWTMENCA